MINENNTKMTQILDQENYTESGSKNPCICCGKHIAKTNYSVHLLVDGEITTELDADDSLGFFPIGNSCKKNIPKEFLFKF